MPNLNRLTSVVRAAFDDFYETNAPKKPKRVPRWVDRMVKTVTGDGTHLRKRKKSQYARNGKLVTDLVIPKRKRRGCDGTLTTALDLRRRELALTHRMQNAVNDNPTENT